MAQNYFDQACRYTAKLDPIGTFRWILRLNAEQFRFSSWIDTRTIPFPGEPDRICDTVARIENPRMGGIPWAMVLEFQIQPMFTMFGRLLEYLAKLWNQSKPDEERGSRYELGAIVVNLTGRGNSSRQMIWPEVGLRTELTIIERNLEIESAEETIGKIETGEWSPSLLPWIPLMQGGDQSSIIERWKQIGEREPDPRTKSDYGALALVFAEAADRRTIWKEALKEWNMIQSVQVNEWTKEAEAKGRVEERITAILELLSDRFEAVPEDVRSKILEQKDLITLKDWFHKAAKSQSIEEFQSSINS